jgi:hypothetical protein
MPHCHSGVQLTIIVISVPQGRRSRHGSVVGRHVHGRRRAGPEQARVSPETRIAIFLLLVVVVMMVMTAQALLGTIRAVRRHRATNAIAAVIILKAKNMNNQDCVVSYSTERKNSKTGI